MAFELQQEPHEGEITTACPLCNVPLYSVEQVGGLVGCEPCGCSVYASVATTFVTPEGVFVWREAV